jgi:hypothetical protein
VAGIINLGNSTVFITEEERTRNTLQNGDFSYPLFFTFQITITDPNTQDKIIIYERKISIQDSALKCQFRLVTIMLIYIEDCSNTFLV